ncbi:MAG: hypothetical protein JWS11_2505 [Cypionkella sp.]|nr:hypothetical protein [Cypionkella sp.]
MIAVFNDAEQAHDPQFWGADGLVLAVGSDALEGDALRA